VRTLRSEKVGVGHGRCYGCSGVNALPWSWKNVLSYACMWRTEFCLTLRAPRSEKSAERPQARRGMFSRDLLRARVALSRAGVVDKWTWKWTGRYNPTAGGPCSREADGRG